jgi:hypothetical protein
MSAKVNNEDGMSFFFAYPNARKPGFTSELLLEFDGCLLGFFIKRHVLKPK